MNNSPSSASGGHGAYPEMTRSDDPSSSDGPAEIPSPSTQSRVSRGKRPASVSRRLSIIDLVR